MKGLSPAACPLKGWPKRRVWALTGLAGALLVPQRPGASEAQKSDVRSCTGCEVSGVAMFLPAGTDVPGAHELPSIFWIDSLPNSLYRDPCPPGLPER